MLSLSKPRRTFATLLLISIALSFAAPALAQATVETNHSYTFGQKATFSLALPNAAIQEATVYLQINHGQTTSHSVPLTNGQGNYIRNLQEAPFPAFADITYWWMYQDAQGTPHNTPKQTFLYEDNRYRWQTLSSGDITLYWVAGDANVMNEALDVARQTQSDLQKYLHAPAERNVLIYIYPSLQDMQSALRLTGQSWVGGVARPEVGVVLVNLPPTANAISKMKRDIPHEMTHKALYDLLGPQGYDALPLWLEEGLASIFEQSPDPTYAVLLQQAQQTGSLLDINSLCDTLPTDRDQILLAYAQMQSFVTYLVENYGWSQLRALLATYADGLACSVGVEQIYGKPLTSLEFDWRVWLAQNETPNPRSAFLVTLRDLAPWVILLLLISVPTLLMLMLS